MPTDSRRLNGPSECFSPYDFCSTNDDEHKAAHLSLMNGDFRRDGRPCNKIRQISLNVGVVTQARGSAYLEMGKTKVICAVYGPREVMRREDFSLKGQLTCDFKFMTFSCALRQQHQQDEQEKDMSVCILEAMESAVCLHKYPKSQINIYVMVLQSDGSALSAAITAASVAMASAGIEMYDIVLASSVAQLGTLTLADPTLQEEDAILNEPPTKAACAGTVTVSFLPTINQISAMSSNGHITSGSMKQLLHDCIENCQKLYPLIRHNLVTHIESRRKCQS